MVNIDNFRVTYADNGFPKTESKEAAEIAATKIKAAQDDQKTRTIGHYVVGKYPDKPRKELETVNINCLQTGSSQ